LTLFSCSSFNCVILIDSKLFIIDPTQYKSTDLSKLQLLDGY
jgi:hypothetical protein